MYLFKKVEKKEVPKNPKPPSLSEKVVKLITKLCFRKDEVPERADLVFVYSSGVYTKELGEIIGELLKHEISRQVLITGGVTKYYDSQKLQKSESDLVLEKIDRSKFPGVEFLQEENSTNTLENVTESLELVDFNGLNSVLFVSKSHAAGRCYLTLRKYAKKPVIYQKTYDTKYPEATKPISEKNWHTFEFGRERVWGEYLRIRNYGSRGDIEFEEVENLVSRIDRLLSL